MARTEARRGAVVAATGVVVVALVVLVVVGLRGSGRDAAPGATADRTGSATVAADSFGRDVKTGWGAADLGGEWRSGADQTLSVGGGTGAVTLQPGAGTRVSLSSVQPADLRASVDLVASDPRTTGGGVYSAVELRGSSGFFYRCVLRQTGGVLFVSLARQDGSAKNVLTLAAEQKVATGVTAGQVFHVVCQATGSGPVRLAAAAARGTPPREWQVTTTDDSASAIVAGGQTTLWSYLSGSSKGRQVVRYDDLALVALAAGDLDGPPTGGAPGSTSTPGPGGRSASPSAPPSASASAPGAATGSRQPPGAAPGTPDDEVPGDALVVSGEPARSGGRATYPSIAQAVDAAPDGGTVVVREGSYHESVVLPRGKRLTLMAWPGEEVWLDGSSPVDGWRRDGSRWVVDGWDHLFDSSPTYTRGAPEDPRPGWTFVDPRHPMAAHPDQVWVDGEAQRQVASRGAVGRGSFYVDEGARQLVLGTDPDGRRVRASTLSTGLTVVGEGDVVRGLGVRRYATSVWQLGAVLVAGRGAALSDLTVADNATTGLSVIADDVSLRRVTARANGLMGIHAHAADDLSGTGLLVVGNNTERFNRAPSAGGMKVTQSDGVRVSDSRFGRNVGHGFWCDMSCTDLSLQRSELDHNSGSGAVVEISSGVSLSGNLLRANDLDGLWLIDTDRAEVTGNVVADNRRSGFQLAMDDRWRTSDGELPWLLRDVDVRGNVVRQTAPGCVVCLDDKNRLLDPRHTTVRLEGNVYQRGRSASVFARWPGADRITRDVADLAAFQAEGQDAGSVEIGAGTPAVDDHGRLSEEATAALAAVRRASAAGSSTCPATPSASC